MKFVIRTDAARHIGTGHVMRCLTLARALRDEGAEVVFISRLFDGHLIDYVRNEGFKVYELFNEPHLTQASNELAHSHWLPLTEAEDLKQCSSFLADEAPDWVIIDHYALSEVWENEARAFCKKVMVIDDLADRNHNCDVLLDQNFGSKVESYEGLVPKECLLLLGTDYALLRPEFAKWRESSLDRRQAKAFALNHILVNLGGIDKDNYTLKILRALESSLSTQTVTVVMGASAPHIESINAYARDSTYGCQVLVGVNNMAELMANADLAIGAAGVTSWERCCVGLPTILLVIADNQRAIATNLSVANAAWSVSLGQQFENEVVSIFRAISASTNLLKDKSIAAATVIDGMGVDRVLNEIERIL